MDNSISYSPKDFNSNHSPNKKIEFWVDLDAEGAKYRDIPVFQTFDDFDPTDFYCQNVSGGKERKKKIAGLLKGDTDHLKSTSIAKAGRTKKRTNLDPAISANALQSKHYPEHFLKDRTGQGSVSEPTLCHAKDRGDSLDLRDFCRDDKSTSHKCFGDGKGETPEVRGVGGCIYVRRGGKVYKSTIETRKLEAVDGLQFGSRNKPDGRARDSEEPDDFEIAIFLSGVANVPEKKQRKLGDGRKREDETQKRGKRKKKNARKNETAVMLGKKFDIGSKIYRASTKMLTIDPYGTKNGFLDERFVKSKIRLKLSSDSEGEYVLEIPDKAANCGRRRPNVRDAAANLIASDESKSRDVAEHYTSKPDERLGKGTSQSSFYHFGDVYKTPKRKVCDEELWGTFETIFRSYASTTRHSGEVIPRKISTEWMRNAGVVDEILTEKEADDAFRRAAGAKITMNAQEYKEFLILLTLRMKLPYYEIYRRMCGI